MEKKKSIANCDFSGKPLRLCVKNIFSFLMNNAKYNFLKKTQKNLP